MTERITFLKRNLSQNSFGEAIETYKEVGKGWASIKFKSVDSTVITYQVKLQRPVPKFHRIIWRGQQYALKSGMMIEGDYHTLTFFIQIIHEDR